MRPSTCSTTGPGHVRARFVVLVLLAFLGWACGAPRQRFAGACSSPEALAEAFLGALEAGDRPRLEALALSEEEFALEAYPEMPAYGHIPTGLAWNQLSLKSLYGLSTVLARHGGRAFILEDIAFRGRTTAYQTFAVRRDPMLRLRDRASGETQELALFGSVLEYEGGFKLFSFNIDR
jgi:hypothetical protein